MERFARASTWIAVAVLVALGFVIARPGDTFFLKASAYTSSVRETDSTPFITATGARTRVGIIAVSRDLLKVLPYGSRVRLEDLGSRSSGRGRGLFNSLFKDTVFVVEDTMHSRKRGQIDVWFPERREAIRFGVRNVKVTVVQVGRSKR
ncbi:MAG: 3D domain-containing protein [Deinococcus sp.]|nr:3D domain-containing protein [Deinococcus sp.]MCL5964620.1 3D domain-containing protein [Deinococcus sp.]